MNELDTMTASAYQVRRAIVEILQPLAVVLIVAGLILGLTDVGGGCGKAFGGKAFESAGCAVAEAARFPFALLALAVGFALGVSAAVIAAGTRRPT